MLQRFEAGASNPALEIEGDSEDQQPSYGDHPSQDPKDATVAASTEQDTSPQEEAHSEAQTAPQPDGHSASPQTTKVPSAVSAFSRTRVCGRNLTLGSSAWVRYMRHGRAFDDKTAALADVMGEKVPMVIAGLYPWHMGKTSFLDALNGFLAVVSDISCNKRMEAFKECAIYQDYRECFDKHFARYAVFKLDLK
ncbi:hypothetical protein LPJ61_002112, partial [Coemansia biformis]